MSLVVGWTEDGKQESLIITCDGCGEVIRSLDAAWLAYPMLGDVQDRVTLQWMHRPCAEPQAQGDGMPCLWRAGHALKALMHRKEVPQACEPAIETSEDRRWLATHLDPEAPLVVEERVQAKLRELEQARPQVVR